MWPCEHHVLRRQSHDVKADHVPALEYYGATLHPEVVPVQLYMGAAPASLHAGHMLSKRDAWSADIPVRLECQKTLTIALLLTCWTSRGG